MAYGAWEHNKLQLGKETVAGTAVAATEIWRGVFSNIKDERKRQIVDENIGVLVTAERTYTSMLGATLAIPACPLTYEQFAHVLEGGVQTATPVGSGPYVRTYSFPTGNTVNTIKTYTWEAANVIATQDYREAEYCFVEEFTVTGKNGECIEMTSNWRGRKTNTGTVTSLSSLLTVEEALMQKTKLYIDASGGTIGTTQKSGVFMGFDIHVKTGILPVPVGDGQLYFAAHKFTKPEITVSLTLELESTVHSVADERASFEAEDVKLLRVSMPGSSASRLLNIDMAVKWDSVDDYQNSNGNTTVKVNGHAVYSQADTLFWTAALTNLRSAL